MFAVPSALFGGGRLGRRWLRRRRAAAQSAELGRRRSPPGSRRRSPDSSVLSLCGGPAPAQRRPACPGCPARAARAGPCRPRPGRARPNSSAMLLNALASRQLVAGALQHGLAQRLAVQGHEHGDQVGHCLVDGDRLRGRAVVQRRDDGVEQRVAALVGDDVPAQRRVHRRAALAGEPEELQAAGRPVVEGVGPLPGPRHHQQLLAAERPARPADRAPPAPRTSGPSGTPCRRR